MSLDASPCPKGLAKGVIIEVLWDIERCTNAGRRSGEKLNESVWWQAEVLDLCHEGESLIARVRYESMYGFKSQTARLYVFPSHMQPIGENAPTQFRWRFFESSGNVSYDCSFEGNEMHVAGSYSLRQDDGRLSVMQCRLDHLYGKIQDVEKLALSKKEDFSPLSGPFNVNGNRIECMLAILRQKLATNTQKALPWSRLRGEDGRAPIDHTCTGTIRASVDFSADDFEDLCQSIHKQGFEAEFKADRHTVLPRNACLKACTSSAEVLFGSLHELCRVLRITHKAARMTIAFRKKHAVSNLGSDDVVARVCGTFLRDSWRDDAPSAILLCRGLHENVPLQAEVGVLVRKSMKLDPVTAWYREPLCLKTMPISDVLEFVSNATEDETNKIPLDSTECRNVIKGLAAQMSCFALRWKPLPNLNQKLWTRRITNNSSVLYGTLEVEIPYLLIRGSTAVSQVEKLLTKECMLKVID